jgi:hypothetical protein
MPRPSHPALHVDDVRNAPLIERGTARVLDLICPTAQGKYFSRGDWTTQITLKSRAKLDFTRRGFLRLTVLAGGAVCGKTRTDLPDDGQIISNTLEKSRLGAATLPWSVRVDRI